MNEDLAKCHQCGRQSPGSWTRARPPAWPLAHTSSRTALSLKCALAIQKRDTHHLTTDGLPHVPIHLLPQCPSPQKDIPDQLEGNSRRQDYAFLCGVKKQVLSRTQHERLAPRSQGSRAPGLPGD